jgi:hypothetical protein
LIKYINDSLWGNVDIGTAIGIIAPDMLVATAVIVAASFIIRKANWKHLAVGAALTGSVLLLLNLDMRVRQLWLKPIDIDLLRYTIVNAFDLTSGADLFFNYGAAFGMTFRKLLFFVGIAHIVTWCIISWTVLSLPNFREKKGTSRRPVRGQILVLTTISCVVATIAVMTPRAPYRLNENILVSPLINVVRSTHSADDPVLGSLAVKFDQKTEPLSAQLKLERVLVRDIKPFKNVVIVVYESVRWRDIVLDDREEVDGRDAGTSNATSPTLAQMASQGMLSKSYVSIPHSAKAYFAILSGRHPYPGVEMRESVPEYQASIFHEFIKSRQGSTFAFSSLFLGFENMGGLLKALGLEQRLQTDSLAKAEGLKISTSTSFGSSDELLYPLGIEHLNKTTKPFAAVFFPNAAH